MRNLTDDAVIAATGSACGEFGCKSICIKRRNFVQTCLKAR